MPDFPWEVTLCYKDAAAKESEKWSELQLKRADTLPQLLSHPDDAKNPMLQNHRNAFCGELPLELEEGKKLSHVVFTAKYRMDSTSPWYWMESQFGIANGELMVKAKETDIDIKSLMDVESAWTVEKVAGVAENTSTHKLKSSLLAAAGGPVSTKDSVVGGIKDLSRFFAVVQMPEPWLMPRHGKKFYIPEDAMLCSFLITNGHTITLLALSGFDDVRVVLKSTDDGKILASAQNDGSKGAHAQIIASIASNLEDSIAAATSAARDILAQTKSAVDVDADIEKSAPEWVDSDESKLALSDWYDGLAYCTWNSLGYDLNVSKILSGLDSLEKVGVKPSSLIIDDNWQSIDYDFEKKHRMHQGMQEFEAVKSAFPDGMKAAISEIREKHPYLKDIAVWHALLGYWAGISPDGKIAKDYKTVDVNARLLIDHKITDITTIAPEDVHRFYDDFYNFLASCGITAVKTDVQYMLNELTHGPDRAAFLSTYPQAWTNAYLKHFQGRAISCMSQIPQNLLLTYLPTDKPRVMVRNSDDFFPEIATSHPLHIFINAHNALFMQNLNVLPDWDMFQTSHPFSAFHAAARCISGGPLYITDSPGEHDVSLIRSMTATSAYGKTIGLRPTTLGRTLQGWNNFLEGHVLKIGAFTGTAEQGTGTSILGLFNIAEKPTSCFVSLDDFVTPGGVPSSSILDDKERQVLVRSHLTAQFFPPTSINATGPESLFYTTLPLRGFELLYSHPILSIPLPQSKTQKVSILGLMNKMTGPAAVLSTTIKESKVETKVTVGLKALGTLGVWSESEVKMDMVVSIMGHDVGNEWWTARKVDRDGKGYLLEVDVEGFWDAIGVKPKKGGEILVDFAFD